MAKPKSGYKRRFGHQPPEGVKIQLRPDTHSRIKNAALESGCTPGQWLEGVCRNYRKLGWAAPAVKRAQPSSGAFEVVMMIEISELEYDEIRRMTGDKPLPWIAAVVMFALAIEEERLRGVREQPERFG